MATDWPVFEVSALIAGGVLEVGDGYRAKRSELAETGLPFARAGNINDGFHFDDVEHLGWDGVEAAKSKVSEAGDVVFTSKGTVGRFAIVKDETRRFVYSPQLCYWRSLRHDVLDPGYIHAWMNSRAFLHQVAAVKSQTDMADYVSLRDQRRMRITVPPLDEQHRISAILGALDDKIELSRRMNHTLERMSQTLFKSWFIDFDGHDDLVDSELGPIPRGWAIRNIGEAVQVFGGTTPSTKEPRYWKDGIHNWATPKDLSGLLEPVLLETGRSITDEGLARISSGLLPAGTFLLSSRAPVGYTAIAATSVAINQGFIAIPPGGELPPSYLLFWARANLELIKGRAGGTTFAEISKGSFRSIPILIPALDLLSKFCEFVDPVLSRIAEAARESRTLSALRDTLLPKLTSGDIRVPEAEEMVSGLAS